MTIILSIIMTVLALLLIPDYKSDDFFDKDIEQNDKTKKDN